jgi:hypothetical protein
MPLPSERWATEIDKANNTSEPRFRKIMIRKLVSDAYFTGAEEARVSLAKALSVR